MKRTKIAIQEFVESVDANRASGVAELGVKNSRRDAMEKSLQAGIRYQRKLALVPIAVGVLILAAALFLVIYFRESPEKVAAIFGASGLSLGFPAWFLIRTMRELWYYEMIAAMIPNLTLDELSAALKSILQKFGKPIEPEKISAGASL